ncbi:MAG: inner membrane CreD family protein [bacterium]|nr:inner membrane CreD family protein [bacterium]
MFKKIAAIIFIYFCTVIAWVFLGSTMHFRSTNQDVKLKGAVRQLWGSSQKQTAPEFYYFTERIEKVEKKEGDKIIQESRAVREKNGLAIHKSDINVKIDLEHRRKGLLWYSTYKVDFKGTYTILNEKDTARETYVVFSFPNVGAVYDNFEFAIAGQPVEEIEILGGQISQKFLVPPGGSEEISISYSSQGLDEWWYLFGEDVSQVKNFKLDMETNFKKIDFPQDSISPTIKKEEVSGWKLTWQYTSMLSGVQIGMKLPQKLNPGPWVGKVTLWAWVSLFLFFFLVFIISIVKEIKIHPMHYLFIAMAYFSFHLLLAYLVDHISIHLAFAISAVVSIFLVISYMRIIVGAKNAFLAIGLSQFVYLILFSYTFFFEKFTGLAITILCIVTLFIVMQITARINWEEMFSKKG